MKMSDIVALRIIGELEAKDPNKVEEFLAFEWFRRADGIEYTRIDYLRERPDFFIEVNGRSIGVEIRRAFRNLPSTRSAAMKIERAQNAFKTKVMGRVNPKLPLEIGFIFDDEKPVDKSSVATALDAVVSEIDRASETMQEHSVVRLVRNTGSIRNGSDQTLHVCEELPAFLQSIQLFNDGHRFTVEGGSRGCIPYDFTDQDLEPILHEKHNKLRGYEHFDEQWLVIVAGKLPPIGKAEKRSIERMMSMSQAFSGVSVSTPIVSDFDRVVFFQSPTTVHQLT